MYTAQQDNPRSHNNAIYSHTIHHQLDINNVVLRVIATPLRSVRGQSVAWPVNGNHKQVCIEREQAHNLYLQCIKVTISGVLLYT